MSSKNQLIPGSIIGVKKEFEEKYIALLNHTFPEVLEQMRRSDISNYSIFSHNGNLFSHVVYNGTNSEADAKATGIDKTTQEWWKLTDEKHQLLDYRKDNEWRAAISIWYSYHLPTTTGEKGIRYAYIFPAPSDLQEKVADDYFGDIGFWGSTYDLKTLQIFKGAYDVYIYLETLQLSDHSFLLEIIGRVLKTDTAPVVMAEVFHTENPNSI